jgi:GH18 family chitinase
LGPPKTFGRIGYYESYNLGRDCLHRHARNANTDGSYTHMLWAFAEIDSKTWRPIIRDPNGQWQNSLQLKRIISFGGWAYSTESATFNIIRQAILTNHESFASSIVQFLNDEGIDGVDIYLEYPGVSSYLPQYSW